MQYHKIRKMDIANGPGIRVSIFMQGCAFNCPGCFNPETHSFDGGKEFNNATIDKILELSNYNYIKGLSILGGEPLHKKNIDGTTELAKIYKEKFPDKTIWLWSGFLYEDYIYNKEILNYIDVLVDGQFKMDLSNPNLKWRGSSNQRVIDVKKSIKNKKVVLYEGEEV